MFCILFSFFLRFAFLVPNESPSVGKQVYRALNIRKEKVRKARKFAIRRIDIRSIGGPAPLG